MAIYYLWMRDAKNIRQIAAGPELHRFSLDTKAHDSPPNPLLEGHAGSAFAWTGLPSPSAKSGFTEAKPRSEARPLMQYYLQASPGCQPYGHDHCSVI